MKLLSLILAGILLVVSTVLAVPVPVAAALPAATVIAGRERAVYLSFTGEGPSEGTVAMIKARLEQDVQVLEQVLLALHQAEKLDSRYPVLLVRIRRHPQADRGFSPPAAVLSFTPAAALISGFPLDLPADGIYRPDSLGRAYVIDTTLVSFPDLLALTLLLPRVGEQSPALTITDEKTLDQVKTSPEFQAFSKARLEFGPPLINWGSPDSKGLLPVWEAGVFFYNVYDLAGNRLLKLEPLDYYLAGPSWSLPAPRLLAAATETDLYFVELPARKNHRLDLTALFPQKYLQMAQYIALAINLPEGQICFTLDRNLPEAFWQTEDHTYRFALDSGEIRVAASKAPETPDQAPEPPPASGPGAIPEFIAPSPGDVSFVHRLLPEGWQHGRISRHEGYLNPHWAELLPQGNRFVFRPIGLLEQSRFVAYGSREELVLSDLVEGKHHRLNLKELRPADYTEISAIRFAQNPNHPGEEIYFSLESGNVTRAAYVWSIVTTRVEQVGETLADKQRMGWQEFTPGAAHHLLPEGSTMLTGNEAKGAIFRYYLSLVAGACVSLAAWVSVLLFAFGLPFTLAQTLIFMAAIKLKSTRLLFSFGPALTTVLFVGFSFLTIRLTLPYSDLIKGLVYPLPWFYHLGSSAGMVFLAGFITAVIAVLTILVFHQSRLLPRAFFPGAGDMHRESKGIVISAGAVYGLAGAVLILLLFYLAATTLPYYRWPGGLDIFLFIALVYGLCLAATYYLLRATPAAAGYLAAAAAFLGVGYVTIASIGMIRIMTDYEQSVTEIARQLFTLERWLGHGALILPLTLTCMVYLARRELTRRGRTLKAPEALGMAALIAVPATAIILYGELLPWAVPGLGIFTLPAAVAFFTVTAVSILAALVLVFIYPSREPMAAKDTLPAKAPAAKKLRLPFGPAAAGIAALVIIVQMVMERATGVFTFLGWLLVAAVFYLAVASVFYPGRFLAVRLAKQVFTPERVRELIAKS